MTKIISDIRMLNILQFFQKRFDFFLEKLNDDQKKLFTSSSQFFLFMIFAVYFNRKENRSKTAMATFAFLGGPYLMSSLTQEPIDNFKSALVPFLPQFIIQDRNKKIFKYQKKYDLIKGNLSTSEREKFSSLLTEFEISRKVVLQNDWESTREQEMLDRSFPVLDYLFKLTSVLSTTHQQTYIKGMTLKLDEIVKNYDSGVTRILREKVLKPVIVNMDIKLAEKMPISPIYLKGAPGTGKTRFVNLLAETLQIPIINFEYLVTNIDDDNSNQYNYGASFREKKVHPFTKLVYKMKTKHKNIGVFFIDELDKNFSHNDKKLGVFLLKLLNPDKEFVEDPYLGINISIKETLVICTGNKNLPEISDDLTSLENRFVTIEFPALSNELKKNIALEHAQKYFKRDLTFDETNYVDHMVISDKNPGVRQLIMNIQAYAREKTQYTIFNGTQWQ